MASRPLPPSQSGEFFRVLTAAVEDLQAFGYDTAGRLEAWLKRLDVAARQSLVPEAVVERNLRQALTATFQKTLTGMPRRHPGVDQFTLNSIKPRLHSELNRRILATTGLIKLNREQSIARTLQRFAGWASAIPAGGSKAVDRAEAKKSIRKAVGALPFEERRVIIDQGHKLVAAIDAVVAEDAGAIAAVWRHVHEAGSSYEPRPEHLARDSKIFVIRGNWALQKGFMKLAGRKFTDQLTAPGEEIYCRCRYEYLYTLRDLPTTMITERGQLALRAARARIQMMHPMIANR